MNELAQQLQQTIPIRTALRELTLTDLLATKEKFNSICDKLIESKEIALQDEQKAIEKAKSLAEEIKLSGIDTEVLLAALSASPQKIKKPKKTRPALYQYEIDGVTKTWTGQGRTPKKIQSALQEGKSLDDFKIQNT
ncbi:H-NS histone family protein [Vibrio sp.]|nr:H-NS histone family protein [Vibrio sp.]